MDYDLYEDGDSVYVETTRLPKRWPKASITAVTAEVESAFKGFYWIPVTTAVDDGETLHFVRGKRKPGRPHAPNKEYRVSVYCTEEEWTIVQSAVKAVIRETLAKLRAK